MKAEIEMPLISMERAVRQQAVITGAKPTQLFYGLVVVVAMLFAACATPQSDARRDSTKKSAAHVDSMLKRVVDINGVPTDTAGGEWQVSKRTNEIDGAVTTSLMLQPDHLPVAEQPFLVVQCKHGKAFLFLDPHGAVQSATEGPGTDVRYRSDEGKPVSARWLEIENPRIIAPTNAVPLIRQIAASKRWRLEYTPFQSAAVVANFRPAGLNAALKSVGPACRL